MACLLPRSVKKIAGHVLPVAKIFGFAPENGRLLRMYAHFSSLRNWKIQPPDGGALFATFTPCGKWTTTASGIFGSLRRHEFVLTVVLTLVPGLASRPAKFPDPGNLLIFPMLLAS